MMTDIQNIISCLEQTPGILENLVKNIPDVLLKAHRRKGKWCIHEHVCHLPQAERMILERFRDFEQQDAPKFTPYLPGKTVPSDDLISMDLDEQLAQFRKLRKSLVDLVASFDDLVWTKKAEHSEFMEYNAYILLRHTLMHDHFHMYRMEELWLTKEEYL